MQSLLRAFRSGAGRLPARALSSAAPEATAEQWGVKNKLLRILGEAEQPLTSAELWEKAQVEGLKSKRHMKAMLQQLKLASHIKTQRVGSKKHKAFGYYLPRPKNAGSVEATAQQQGAKSAAA